MKVKAGEFKFPWHLISVFLIVVLGLGAAGALFYSIQKENFKDKAQLHIATVADLKVSELVNWRKGLWADARLVQRDGAEIRNILPFLENSSASGSRRAICVWLQLLQGSHNCKSVVLLDREKHVRLYSGEDTKQIGSRSGAYMEEAIGKKGIVFSNLDRDEITKDLCLDIFISLLNAQEKVIAVLLLRLDPKECLFPLLQPWPKQSSTAEMALVRREGKRVLFLNQLRHKEDAPLNFYLPLVRKQVPAVMAATGQEGIVAGLDYRGVPVLAAIKAVPGTSWHLIAKIDVAEVYASLHSQAWVIITTIGILVILFALILGYVWKKEQAYAHRKQSEAELERKALTQHYDYLTKYANDMVILMDGELNILDANEKAVASLGYTYDELRQKNILAISVDENVQQAYILKESVEKSDGIVFERNFQRKDGTTFPVEVSARVINIEGKKFHQGIVRDIAQRKLDEKRLRESEARLRAIIEKNADGIMIVGSDGILQFMNPAAESLFGRKAERMLGALVGFPVLAGEMAEIEVVGSNGVRCVAEMRATPLAWEGKEAFLVSIHDMTERKQAGEALQKTLLGTVQAIAAVIEMRDPYTAGHQRRVSALAQAMAREMGFTPHRIEGIRLAGMIHDIGKVSLPAEILSKPGKISDIEFDLVKTHPQSGHSILKEIEFPWPIDQMVFQHHERYDGSGYPQGLSDEEMMAEAKIIAVADVVEAMAMHRPYRPARGIDAALEEIQRNSGILYNPEAVGACLRLCRAKGFKFDG